MKNKSTCGIDADNQQCKCGAILLINYHNIDCDRYGKVIYEDFDGTCPSCGNRVLVKWYAREYRQYMSYP